MTPKVYGWLDERNVKYIRREERLSNSPDLSFIDFGLNWIFKQILFGKETNELDGLKRVARQVWAGYRNAVFKKIKFSVSKDFFLKTILKTIRSVEDEFVIN
jgi:hypothetical protein